MWTVGVEAGLGADQLLPQASLTLICPGVVQPCGGQPGGGGGGAFHSSPGSFRAANSCGVGLLLTLTLLLL